MLSRHNPQLPSIAAAPILHRLHFTLLLLVLNTLFSTSSSIFCLFKMTSLFTVSNIQLHARECGNCLYLAMNGSVCVTFLPRVDLLLYSPFKMHLSLLFQESNSWSVSFLLFFYSTCPPFFKFSFNTCAVNILFY